MGLVNDFIFAVYTLFKKKGWQRLRRIQIYMLRILNMKVDQSFKLFVLLIWNNIAERGEFNGISITVVYKQYRERVEFNPALNRILVIS